MHPRIIAIPNAPLTANTVSHHRWRTHNMTYAAAIRGRQRDIWLRRSPCQKNQAMVLHLSRTLLDCVNRASKMGYDASIGDPVLIPLRVAAVSSKQPLFRYTLRQLLICMLVFGVLLGWLGAQIKWKQDRIAAQMWLLPLQARSEAAATGGPIPPRKGFYVRNGEFDAPWVLSLLGESGVGRIELKREFLGSDSPYSLRRFQSLFPEAEIVFAAPEPMNPPTKGERLITGN